MINESKLRRIEALRPLVGHTPMLKISYKYKGKPNTIFAKAEYYNYSGSIKDRMAYHILSEAIQNGSLKEGDTIVEATSGNTGIAFSALGRALGHKVKIFMPNWMSKERMALISGYGADIQLVSKEEGGFLGSIAMTQQAAQNDDTIFLPCQFDNCCNCDAHFHSTAPEMMSQLAAFGKKPDIVVAGVGTGGTVMGLRNYFKDVSSAITIHPLEPANSPTLSTGHKVGTHRIQGISDEFIPSIVELDKLDKIVEVDDGDSIIAAQKMARVLGLGVGISSGANFLGALLLQQENPDATVVTVFADDSKKYLSTDYSKEEPIKEGFLSPDLEFLGIEAIKCDENGCRKFLK